MRWHNQSVKKWFNKNKIKTHETNSTNLQNPQERRQKMENWPGWFKEPKDLSLRVRAIPFRAFSSSKAKEKERRKTNGNKSKLKRISVSWRGFFKRYNYCNIMCLYIYNFQLQECLIGFGSTHCRFIEGTTK